MDQLWAVLLALIPSVGVGFLFYKIMKLILEGDRRERLAYSKWQAEHDRKAQSEQTDAALPDAPPVNGA